jgi:hypothetical protein
MLGVVPLDICSNTMTNGLPETTHLECLRKSSHSIRDRIKYDEVTSSKIWRDLLAALRMSSGKIGYIQVKIART